MPPTVAPGASVPDEVHEAPTPGTALTDAAPLAAGLAVPGLPDDGSALSPPISPAPPECPEQPARAAAASAETAISALLDVPRLRAARCGSVPNV
jgi:hypothetical protein